VLYLVMVYWAHLSSCMLQMCDADRVAKHAAVFSGREICATGSLDGKNGGKFVKDD
jgi:hypothetical protein